MTVDEYLANAERYRALKEEAADRFYQLLFGQMEYSFRTLAECTKLLNENSPELRSPIGQVTCPNCQVAMSRIALKSSDGEQSLNEAIYRCPECEAETKRWISPQAAT